MKALLISLVIIGLVGAAVGGGLFAMFSDTETSNGNTFASGNLNLKMGPAGDEVDDSTVALVYATNLVPTDTVAVDVSFKNDTASTISGNLTVTWAKVAGSSDALAAELVITDATYDGASIQDYLEDTYGDGTSVTVAELVSGPAFVDAVPLAPGDAHELAMTVTFNADATGPEGASYVFSITGLLSQIP